MSVSACRLAEDLVPFMDHDIHHPAAHKLAQHKRKQTQPQPANKVLHHGHASVTNHAGCLQAMSSMTRTVCPVSHCIDALLNANCMEYSQTQHLAQQHVPQHVCPCVCSLALTVLLPSVELQPR